MNLAKRLHEAAEPGRINIFESTYCLVSKLFDAELRGSVETKQKVEVRMFYPLDPR